MGEKRSRTGTVSAFWLRRLKAQGYALRYAVYERQLYIRVDATRAEGKQTVHSRKNSSVLPLSRHGDGSRARLCLFNTQNIAARAAFALDRRSAMAEPSVSRLESLLQQALPGPNLVKGGGEGAVLALALHCEPPHAHPRYSGVAYR